MNDTRDMADLAVALGVPVVLVVGVRLGCINHALLTADAIAARGLKLAGWVANHVDPAMSFPDENIATMRDWLAREHGAPLLGRIPHLAAAPNPRGDARHRHAQSRRCAPRSIDQPKQIPDPSSPTRTGKRYDPSPDRRHRATRRDSVAAPVSQRWRVADVVALFELPFNDLLFRAQQVHREHFDANAVQLSTLLSIKTGGCEEDCGYCSQSSHHDTGLKAEKLMDVDAVLDARAAKANGASRFAWAPRGATRRSVTCRR